MNIIKQFYEIDKQVKDLADKISIDFKDLSSDETPIFICVLQGGGMFFHNLIKDLKIDCITEYVRVKSYNGQNAGKVNIISDVQIDLQGKYVYIIDDMIDTGSTMGKLLAHFSEKGVSGIKTVTLVERKEPAFKSDYCCFRNMGTEWFVGYGFDKDGKCRNYKNLYTIPKEK